MLLTDMDDDGLPACQHGLPNGWHGCLDHAKWVTFDDGHDFGAYT